MTSSTEHAVSPEQVDCYMISPIQRHVLRAGADTSTLPCSITAELTLPTSADDATLYRAFRALAGRHDLLRSDYRRLSGMAEPVQVIHNEPRIDLSADAEAGGLTVNEEFRLAVRVTDRTATGVRLRIALPALLADPASLAVIVDDLASELGLASAGTAGEGPRYADIAQYLTELTGEDATAYWHEQVHRAARVNLPAVGYQGACRRETSCALPEPVLRALHTCTSRSGWAVEDVLLGAMYLLLSRLTGQGALPFALRWDARRAYPELSNIIGPLTFPVPFLLALRPGMSFATLLDTIAARNKANDQHALAYPMLLTTGFTPHHEFTLDFCIAHARAARPGITVHLDEVDPCDGDIAVRWTDLERGTYTVQVGSERYADQDVELFADRLAAVLAQLCADPLADIAAVRPLSEQEYDRTVRLFNATDRDYDATSTVLDQFRARCVTDPDAVAIRTATQNISYADLDERARRIACWLVGHGIGEGDPVPLYVDRQPNAVAAMIGVVMARAVYVPVNTALPPATVASIIERLAPRAVISCARWGSRLAATGATGAVKLLTLDTGWRAETTIECLTGLDTDQAAPAEGPTGADLAYMIFTSGSTGEPKGVLVRHERLSNLVDWVNRTQRVTASDRLLLVAAFSFDLSVYDVWGSLAAGATIRLADEEELDDPRRLVGILTTEQITIWDSAPAALQRLGPLLQKAETRKSRLRLVMLSGDWIPVTLPDELRALFPDVEILAMGGATEATIWSNYHHVTEIDPRWPSIPYGRPIQNCRYYVLDADGRPQPTGVVGELHIGGVCVADGYFADPAGTDARFRPDPFRPAGGDRLYRTGDLVRHLGNGELQFLGRSDDQVKVRGHRIELGEVALALRSHERIREVIVRAHREADGNNALIAYYVPHPPDVDLDRAELAALLTELLPDYAIPAYFTPLRVIPLTGNGKVDYAALPDHRRTAATGGGETPQNETESQLLALWRDILGRDGVPLTQSFFDMGGHSLAAVRLLARIDSELNRRISMPEFVENASIRRLGLLLAAEPTVTPSGIGCLLRGSPEIPPIFAVHPSGGHFLCYQRLARRLGAPHTVYGLQAPGLDAGEQPATSIEELAAVQLRRIRRLQQHGPYHLLGWSLGGVVAFEMAHQLLAAGEQIAPLTIIDRSTSFVDSARYRTPRDLLAAFAADLGGLTGAPFTWQPSAQETAPSVGFINQAVAAGALAPDIPEDAIRTLFEVFAANTTAMAAYRARPLAGELIHFVGSASPTRHEAGWEDVVLGRYTSLELDADHFSLLRDSAPLDTICAHLTDQLSSGAITRQ